MAEQSEQFHNLVDDNIYPIGVRQNNAAFTCSFDGTLKQLKANRRRVRFIAPTSIDMDELDIDDENDNSILKEYDILAVMCSDGEIFIGSVSQSLQPEEQGYLTDLGCTLILTQVYDLAAYEKIIRMLKKCK